GRIPRRDIVPAAAIRPDPSGREALSLHSAVLLQPRRFGQRFAGRQSPPNPHRGVHHRVAGSLAGVVPERAEEISQFEDRVARGLPERAGESVRKGGTRPGGDVDRKEIRAGYLLGAAAGAATGPIGGNREQDHLGGPALET